MTDWTVKRRVAVGRVSLAAASSAALVAAAFGVSTAKAASADGNENGKANAAAVAGDANAETADKPGKLKKSETSTENAAAVELFGDLKFERGFEIVNGPKTLGVLRLPFDGEADETDKSGKRSNLEEGGETEKNGETAAAPTWKLAQHHSKFDLSRPETQTATATEARAATPGLAVARTKTPDGAVALRLEVAADAEYAAPRRADQNWLHLLLQRDFAPSERVSFGDVESLVFTCDAQVLRSERLMTADEFDSNLHATQASVYFAISNDDPESPDFRDYIWFGVSFFDDRWEIQTDYVAVDGDPRTIGTGKLIYRLGERRTIDDILGGVNPFSKKPVRIEIDLAKYLGGALQAAKERGFLTETRVEQMKLAHFNFGWETPGTYRAALEIKNPRLVATLKKTVGDAK
ncbi:MAG: hypothetical protein J6K20_07305 [Thermoguttaceae bacterium]|nr:hypothetical protein [Thermoguttaceae bacterium]